MSLISADGFVLLVITIVVVVAAVSEAIPTTLEGPFQPVTWRFDPSLRRGSDDLPMDHPRLRRNVTSNFPDQIALALSTPTSIWISWVTGNLLINAIIFQFHTCTRLINVL